MSAPLPIDAVLPDLSAAFQAQTQAILAAPPGAGKTTRVPLALLDASWRAGGKILMLEPRRIAARSAAERLASELGEKPGGTVGYRIRGESIPGQAIEVLTDGVLTRMLLSDPSLDGVAAVLFDEAHERSVQSDLALAFCLEAQDALRPDLRLLVMSATLDTGVFRAVMPEAPLIESQGRAYPVETRWLERPWRRPAQGRRGLEQAAADLVARILTEGPDGDILVFLPGAGEIERVRAMLSVPGTDVMPLHGSLPFSRQRAVLSRPETAPRRVILATDIAETSLTVPGVRIVVDAGFVRAPAVDPDTGLSRLITTPVSRASAEQRRGRAGRLGPGICYRMWTRGEEGALPAFATPEILATDLTALALDVAAWGGVDATTLPLPTQPGTAAFAKARGLLAELGALDGAGRLTAHGQAMAARPVHPRLAHMLILAEARDQAPTAALLAALLGERDPLRGTSTDIRDRVRAVLTNGADPGLIARIKTEAKRHHPKLPPPARAEAEVPGLAALAYPDRIAQRRPGDVPRFLLASGRGAVMAPDDPLSAARYLIALDLEDGREARIRQAAPLAEAEIRAQFANRITTVEEAVWSARTNRVEARRQERFGAIALTDQIWKDAAPGALGAALADGIRAKGIAALPWSTKAENLRQRAAWLQARGQEAPDWTNETLLATLDDWLTPHLDGMVSLAETARLDWAALLIGLDYVGAETVAKAAPLAYVTPLGRSVSIDYSQAQPRIAVKVQEMFGEGAHPHVAELPLILDLLSPAGRAVQTTADLPGFWTNSYPDVRKDMRSRYPKHPWPEDPQNAKPTARANPRREVGKNASTKR